MGEPTHLEIPLKLTVPANDQAVSVGHLGYLQGKKKFSTD